MRDLLFYLLPDNIDYALLLFLRVTGLIVSSPIFGRNSVPNITKIMFSLSLTVLFILCVPQAPPVAYMGGMHYMLVCAGEMLFGVVLGFVTTMFFSVVFTAGNIIDTQMGFGMVNVFDPQSGAQVAVTGNLLNIVMLLAFFAANGHTYLIHLLFRTFQGAPVGHVTLRPEIALAAMEAFCNSFILAVRVAMPFIASGLLAEAALGVIIRTVPQMNMFVVGIPLKVIIGFVMLIITIPVFIRFTTVIFDSMFDSVEILFMELMEAV